ncbi:MAG: hypothetical protein LBP22_14975 [Deltaproteobacteria bacterium]|nr:hypothetical protein [Deltaproteobacteria bacterium]
MYGDNRLPERVALKTGLRPNLGAVSEENREITEDIIAIIMFPGLTIFDYGHVARIPVMILRQDNSVIRTK